MRHAPALLFGIVLGAAALLAGSGCGGGSGGGVARAHVAVTNHGAAPLTVEVVSGGVVTTVGVVDPGFTDGFDFCECELGDTIEALDVAGAIVAEAVIIDGEEWIVN